MRTCERRRRGSDAVGLRGDASPVRRTVAPALYGELVLVGLGVVLVLVAAVVAVAAWCKRRAVVTLRMGSRGLYWTGRLKACPILSGR